MCATGVSFLGHSVSESGLLPDSDKVSALGKVPMPKDASQLHSLLSGFSNYRKLMQELVKRNQPLSALLKKGVCFDLTPSMADTVRGLLKELHTPTVLAFPNWDAAQDWSRPFLLYWDACQDGFSAALEQ